MGEPKSEQEVVARFNELRASISTLYAKLADLESEAAEHDLVIKQLEPMDAARRCFRMIGDVLVERTVGETLPAVKQNRDGLAAVVAQLKAQLAAQQKALGEFTAKYKVRVTPRGDGLMLGADEDAPIAPGSKPGLQQQQQQQQRSSSGGGGGKPAGGGAAAKKGGGGGSGAGGGSSSSGGGAGGKKGGGGVLI